jgi:hypothetical protein
VTAKRNAVVALLAVVALWPLAHRVLVARYGIDPWKLGAFAMYATPNLPVLVAAVGTTTSGGTIMIDEATLPVWVRRDLDRFRVERAALGTLRDPEDVGRALLAARPDVTSVGILVQRTTLDPATATIQVATPRYVYTR